jgi:hypothetical protein
MMALRAHARGGAEQLVFEQAPVPVPGAGEALVEVHAAGITFAELTWEESWTTRDGRDRTPVIPSHEVSGVVRGLGDNATGLSGRGAGVRPHRVRPERGRRRLRDSPGGRPGGPAALGVPRAGRVAAPGRAHGLAGADRPRRCTHRIKPWFDDHVYWDTDLIRRWSGHDVDFTRPLPSDLIVAAVQADPELITAVGLYQAMLTLPGRLDAVQARAKEIYASGWRPPIPPGPSRQELAALVTAAATPRSHQTDAMPARHPPGQGTPTARSHHAA